MEEIKTHASLFAGIGGFDLAAEWMGWENVFHCEWNKFGSWVLSNHWGNAKNYGDITKTDFTIWRGKIDILTGGFPCQPYSTAGKRLGKEDERHLWPEMRRAIREIQPRFVVGENVSGLISWNGGLVFEEVQADLEAEGYEVQPVVLPAAGVNAPHRRDRVWFVAYSDSNGYQSRIFGENRCQEKESNREGVQWERVWNDDRGNGKQRIAPNTTSNRWTRYREGIEVKKRLSERSRENRKLERGSKGLCKQWNAPNTNKLHGNLSGFCSGKLPFEQKTGIRLDSYSYSGRQSSQKYREEKSGWTTKKSIPNDWQNFPTQPPVCSGNDGFSNESLRQRIREDSLGTISEEEIDKIFSEAFSEWRKETIMAAGNAIVPQVAYKIFQSLTKSIKQ